MKINDGMSFGKESRFDGSLALQFGASAFMSVISSADGMGKERGTVVELPSSNTESIYFDTGPLDLEGFV